MNPKDNFKKFKIFAMDVDGVLTDGSMYYSKDGEVIKKFNTRDGMGIELLHKKGVIPVIITRENSEIVIKRAEKLKVEEVYIGAEDKLEIVKKLRKKYNANFNEIAYIGDDINDIPLLKKVGFSSCPFDAVDEVKKIVKYICKTKGGEGAVREVVDIIRGEEDVIKTI